MKKKHFYLLNIRKIAPQESNPQDMQSIIHAYIKNTLKVCYEYKQLLKSKNLLLANILRTPCSIDSGKLTVKLEVLDSK